VRALAADGAKEIVVVNRSRDAAEVAAALGGPVARVGGVDEVSGADLVVNATPIGMSGPDAGRLPCPDELLGTSQVVIDLVYDPLETALMQTARARGAEVHGGVSMLVFQAARAFELWTGVDAPVEAMLTAAGDALERRQRGGTRKH
jgi:shikimate 5-dehydrogenase